MEEYFERCRYTNCSMMIPNFKEDKATQAAALLLSLKGAPMSHLKLMKLLYIAEREAILRWRRPIIFDRYVSMNKGPVLSQTLNKMHGECETTGSWERFISTPENNKVKLLGDPGIESLSDAEEALLREVFSLYGHMNRWRLCDLTHEFPEWEDPQGSSIPILYEDILRGAGKTDIEIASIVDEIENIAMMDNYMGQ